MEQSTPIYPPLHQDLGSVEKLLDQSEEDKLQLSVPVRRQNFLRRFLPWLIHGCLIASYVFFFFVLREYGDPSMAACVAKMEIYSPALDAVEYELTKIDGTFDIVSPYTGAGPEVDAAWGRFTWNNSLIPIRLSDEELRKVYKDGRASNVRFSKEDGGGSMGSLNMAHQLHCLDFMRRYIYVDDYPEIQEKMKTKPIFMKVHIDHCMEILRQAIMCNADVGVITYDWVDTFIDPFPDLNMYKKCRNPNKVVDWLNRHALHIDRDHLGRLGDEVPLAMPPDATQLPQWEHTKAYHGSG